MSWYHIEDRFPVARKEYSCFLCNRPIKKGTKHVDRFGFDEGPQRFRMHNNCEHITKKWDEIDWECNDPSDFCDYLDELNPLEQ